MSVKAGVNGRVYLAAYDISGRVNRYGISLPREFGECTGMGDTGRKRSPTLHNNSFNLEAYYDVASGNITEIMNTLRSTSAVASLCFGAAQEDKAIAGYGALQESYDTEIPIDGLVRISSVFRFSDLAVDGYVLQAKATKTSDGNGDGVDDGAQSTDGAEAYLHVFSCGGDDALIVKVQDDDNDSFTSPNDLITFTTANGATSERATASGTVQRYVRVTWSGTPTYSASFAVIWCRL